MKARTFTFDSVKCLAIVSDSHGLLRDSVTAALQDVDLIIHAGDLGSRGVLERLEAFAPVIAVRGNVDSELIDLPLTEAVSVNDHLIYVLHDLGQLDLDPATAGIEMIVHGHSHQPRIDRRDDVLYVNPGSIGPRRFRLPVSMAKVTFYRQELAVQLVYLEKKGPQG